MRFSVIGALLLPSLAFSLAISGPGSSLPGISLPPSNQAPFSNQAFSNQSPFLNQAQTNSQAFTNPANGNTRATPTTNKRPSGTNSSASSTSTSSVPGSTGLEDESGNEHHTHFHPEIDDDASEALHGLMPEPIPLVHEFPVFHGVPVM
jgi:hypothetical protein